MPRDFIDFFYNNDKKNHIINDPPNKNIDNYF